MANEIYYVGIGASAGGLEALEAFFKAVPEDSGLVYIVIQHLSPDYKSLMNELLARHTTMEILVAQNDMMTEPNKVYLIPPRHNLTILGGRLYLKPHVYEKHQLILPIDVFFRSLAKDKEKQAIAVVLSGTGSDGALGIRDIKEMGGMIMVQDEESAKFDGMPRSSMATGLVDYVLPPQNMPSEILKFIKFPETLGIDETIKNSSGELVKICQLLKSYTNVDFNSYKENTLTRRIERRIKINQCKTTSQYIQLLNESDKEKETLYREMLIGVTSFFRDQEAYEALKQEVLSKLDYAKGNLRVWSAGCSTGEEVYSMAIAINEYLDAKKINCDVKLFATDIDTVALEYAGTGIYPTSIAGELEPELLEKYFTKTEVGYQINEQIRKQVVFAKHNILKDPPFSKLDILVCRNLFIYIKSEFQQKILSSFYYALNRGGYLFLGSSESLGDMNEAFEKIDIKWKIYRFRESYRPSINQEVQSHVASNLTVRMNEQDNQSNRSRKNLWFEQMLVEVLRQNLAPSVLVDSTESILHIIGDVSPFFSLQTGRFTNKLLSHVRKELGLYVNNLLRRLNKERKMLRIDNIPYGDDENQHLSLKGSIINLNGDDYFLISFAFADAEKGDVPATIDMSLESQERLKQLELELQIAREGLQATIEELETSNEELQSSNEELIASNEELQSTNEELQSVNEELYTVNNEYQQKIEQLIGMTNDLNNLLKNTEIGALYLDSRLCIRRITPVITRVMNIMENDIGRPIFHLSVAERYKDLFNDVDQVMESLGTVEREIKDANGDTYFVRIRPFRTANYAVDGIIITLFDISKLKRSQKDSERFENRLNSTMAFGKMAWWELDVMTGEVKYSDEKATMLGYEANEFPNDFKGICEYIHPEDYEYVKNAMKAYIDGESDVWDMAYRMRMKTGDYLTYHDQGFATERDEKGMAKRIIGAVMHISMGEKGGE